MTSHNTMQEALNEQRCQPIGSAPSTIGEFVVADSQILRRNSIEGENTTPADGKPHKRAAHSEAILERMYQDYWTL